MEAIGYYTNSELSEELRRRNNKSFKTRLDLVHTQQLQEIVERFYAANWEEREKIYKKVVNI